jgi:hypothetical protein
VPTFSGRVKRLNEVAVMQPKLQKLAHILLQEKNSVPHFAAKALIPKAFLGVPPVFTLFYIYRKDISIYKHITMKHYPPPITPDPTYTHTPSPAIIYASEKNNFSLPPFILPRE